MNTTTEGTTEQNKAIVRAFQDAVNRRDFDAAQALLDPDMKALGLGPAPIGLREFRGFGEMFMSAFPDGSSIDEETIAEGDTVVSRFTFSGTHLGDLMGIPATGKHVTFSGVHISRLANGKIVERYVSQDQLGLLQQLGVIPAMS